MKPRIYVYCVATGTGSGRVSGSTRGGDVLGCAIAEDGEGLAQHLSSSASFAQHDMGITSDWKHDAYAFKYPDGYELVWINESDLDAHEGFQLAFKLNQARPENGEAAVAEVRS